MRDSGLPRRLSLSLLLSSGFLAVPSSFAADCAPAETAAKALAAPQAGLNVALGGEADPELTSATRDAIVALKHGLAAFVDAAAACLSDAVPKPDAFAQALAAPTGSASPTPRFDVRLLQNDALLSVVARFDVPCGEDALWQLYERRDAQWRPVLQWTGAAYDRIDSAWGSFQYAVSPRDADGHWFAAITHVRPWCSSTWSAIDYAIARPGTAAARPRILLAENYDMWWGGGDLGRLQVDAVHAELRFHGSSLDPVVHNREFVRRYAVQGERVERVAPVAATPRGFVDEWLVLAWPQARRWSVADSVLQAAHAQLATLREGATLTFGATRQCADGTVQVEFDIDGNERFLRVAGQPVSYRLNSVATESDPACTRELAEEPAP
ncbi:hypothetical protein ACFJIW_13900 [Tahibacter sp. UC22_41]|uniref:hypothetical protein n=1 Tax=Tahibacter sp. UC22_41 TaxID=3350178 RepID=UPI0036D7F4B5